MNMELTINFFKKAIAWAKLFFTPVALLFLAYFAWSSKDLIINLFVNAQFYWLLLCVLIWLALHTISPIFTVASFTGSNFKLDYKRALLIHVSYLPAKYLPGGIWHSVARSHDYFNLGIDAKTVGTYFLHENILVAAVTLSLGGLIVGFGSYSPPLETIVQLLMLVGIVSIVLWFFALNKFSIQTSFKLNASQYVLSIFSMIIYWLIAAVSFLVFLQIFPDLEITCSKLYTAGIYIFSWGVGFIALFAPQGLGVSEYVASELLCSNLETTSLIVLLAMFRIIILIADLLAWGFAWISKS